MTPNKQDPLEGLAKLVLDNFAKSMIGQTSSLGKYAHPTAKDFATKIIEYMPNETLTDEGRTFLLAQIKQHKAISNAYHSFVEAVGESILELYA